MSGMKRARSNPASSSPRIEGFPSVDELPAIPELPDPFARPDGTRVATSSEWPQQRRALLATVLHYEYGELPPPGDAVVAERSRSRLVAATGATETQLLLRMGPAQAVAARLILTVPPGTGPFPAIIRGDLGWRRARPRIVAEVIRRGYILADFDRTGVAADAPAEDGIYLACPGFDGGRVAAWAWGFHRVVDYLRTLALVDAQRIVVTGHSRGGKAALLAGATDERIALTAPNNSGCGGAGCHRLLGAGSEDIAAIVREFPYWFHPRFADFAGNVDRLPFDQHTVKALVAPRAFLSTEALGDAWANPEGSQQTHVAATEVFAFLGVRERIGIRFRAGRHEHNAADWNALLDFADRQLLGRDLFDERAFPAAAAGYSWTMPGR